MIIRKLPINFNLIIALCLLNLLLFTIFRSVFYFWFVIDGNEFQAVEILQAFYLGLKFDLRLALLVNSPILLVAWLKWFNPFSLQWQKFALRFWKGYLTIANSLLIFLYFMDFGHYDYLNIRIDATVLRFLENPLISANMVWESYPVIGISLGFTLLMAVIYFLNSQLLNYYADSNHQVYYASNLRKYTLISVLCLCYLFGIYGKFSYYPLRWSDAYFSTDSFISALASNPVLYFAETFKNRESGYDIEAARKAYPQMVKYLGITEPDKKNLNYHRNESSHSPYDFQRPNIVMVFMESFGFYKTGLSGNPLNPTPAFDQMARQGILFDHFYTPHGGTARSVFTAITGIPDIELKKTSTRNPLIVEQQSIINAFKDYEKFYFLGGSVSWGNIRGLLSKNIPNLNIYEEGSYKSPREDVWGISDLHLFEEANAILKQQQKPFFAVIQTSGNHRPYTIPEDRRGFESQDKEAEEVAPYGFRSVGDYNSFRFLDHSLGVFLDLIKKEQYGQNTLFVFFGDHGNDRQAKHMYPAEEQLMLTEYHVPFVIYSPGLIKQPKVMKTIASEVDVLPTLASLSGLNYVNTTFGRDLFNPHFKDSRYAFTIAHGQSPDIGLIGAQYIFRMNARGDQKRLYALNSPTPKQNLYSQQMSQGKYLEELVQAYYQTARYIRYNNKAVNVNE